ISSRSHHSSEILTQPLTPQPRAETGGTARTCGVAVCAGRARRTSPQAPPGMPNTPRRAAYRGPVEKGQRAPGIQGTPWCTAACRGAVDRPPVPCTEALALGVQVDQDLDLRGAPVPFIGQCGSQAAQKGHEHRVALHGGGVAFPDPPVWTAGLVPVAPLGVPP